ncbi:hypothetical protein KKG83_02245 [Candidatus Micrarchaeota archaeon]|nr:hypothetical protein [Candidatus Micrarchaeota archaeon]MBU2476271.1 hypothetical protein [Candidatus Micrarchaeota archaeon]
MIEFSFSFGFIATWIIIYLVAAFLELEKNSLWKALLLAFFSGLFIPFVFLYAESFALLFALILFAVFLISFLYKTSFTKSFSLWLDIGIVLFFVSLFVS